VASLLAVPETSGSLLAAVPETSATVVLEVGATTTEVDVGLAKHFTTVTVAVDETDDDVVGATDVIELAATLVSGVMLLLTNVLLLTGMLDGIVEVN